jgi:hypothetical protein
VTSPTARTDQPAKPTSRGATGFYALVAVGCVLALVFGFHAVLRRPVVVLSTPHAQRSGLLDTATVVVRNRSSRRSYCPQIEISALDTSGTELEIATASPVDGNGRLAPNGSVSFRATFTHLTATDYRDKLSKLEGFVIRANPCG